jgi:hypothetical protein
MKPSSWDKQLGLASPRESAASQSDQTINPSKNVERNEVGLDVSHHARISQRGGEKIFYLTSSFIGNALWRFGRSRWRGGRYRVFELQQIGRGKELR